MPLRQFMSTLALPGDPFSCEIVIDRARLPASTSTKCAPVLRRTLSLPARSDPNARWGNLDDGAATSIPAPAPKARTVSRLDSPASPVSSTEFEPNEGIGYSNCEIVVDRATIAPPRRAMSLPTSTKQSTTATADARWGLSSPTPKSNTRNCRTTPSPLKQKRVNSSNSDEDPIPASRDQSPDQPRRPMMPMEPSSSSSTTTPYSQSPMMTKGTTDPNDQGQKLVELIRMLSVRAAMTITKQARPASLETVLECTTNSLHQCTDATTTTPITNVER